MSRAIPEEKLIEDMQRVAEELGKSPSAAEYSEYGEYSHDTVQNRFGRWNSGLREAGLSVNEKSCRDRASGDRLLELYYEKTKTQREIAEELGYDVMSISNWMGEYNIPIVRSKGVRKVICHGKISREEVPHIENQIRRKYGIVIEDGFCVLKKDFILDDDIRSDIERLEELIEEVGE